MGSVGFITCLLLQQSGVREIFAIEPNVFRAELAEQLLSVKSFRQFSHELDNLATITIEAVGQRHFAQTLEICLATTRMHGRILLLGNPTDRKHTIPVQPIIRKNLTIIGSISPPWNTYLHAGIQLVHEHLDFFKNMVTHRFAWKQAEEAFELFCTPNAPRLKILLTGDE